MNGEKILLSMLMIVLMVTTSFGAIADTVPIENKLQERMAMNIVEEFDVHSTLSSGIPMAITVSDADPFYALIATPLTVHYDDEGEQEVLPLYVENFDDPSKAVERAKEQIGTYVDFIINDAFSPKEISLYIAETFWDETSTVLVIKDNKLGYELGVAATPLASYLSIPVIVTDYIDGNVTEVLDNLGVENIYTCGDVYCCGYNVIELYDLDVIIQECIDVIYDRFGETVNYITMTNSLDISKPEVLNTTVYEFSGKIGSSCFLPTQSLSALFGGYGLHEFVIPEDHKYCNLKIDLRNLDSEHVEALGDRIFFLLLSPDGDSYVYGNTAGGLPLRDGNGKIVEDGLHYEIVIYDKPGNYTLQVFGQWFGTRGGSYEMVITLDKLENPIVPLMDGISSMAPYLTAYHKGIVLARPEFAFAADDDVLYNGTTCPGVSQPGTNPNLIVPSNEHTWQIHEELNEILAEIADIPVGNLEELRDHYAENPLYIAIVADPTMVPMYFYKNPDGEPDNNAAYIMGFALSSDFFWGDIDIDPADPENNTYTYWPFQENIVGRVTGKDVQDCSALIARTIFYDTIIGNMGEWKNRGLVQTGCGLEFQNLPIVTRLSHLLYSGRGEPTKFPTGESGFINMRMKEKMETGEFNVSNTMFLQSQREGFTRDELMTIKKAGILNRLLFPMRFIKLLNSDEKVTGGRLHLNSSLIFTFAHGFYNLYEHGDVFIDSRGFPGVSMFSRIYPRIRSSLSNKGSFDLRSVDNMEYGPSVVFVVSCITGRTDGMRGENVMSQAYIHAGANAFIGATRVTADPGYLEPRPLPGGWGLGILGFLKAWLDLKLKGEYPDSHFGALVGEDFILDLIENNSDTGTALRNAKNKYLAKDANSTFLWSPPLSLSSGNSVLDQEYLDSLKTSLQLNERTRVLGKKYVCLHEFTLYGDPAFNPYQPCNEG